MDTPSSILKMICYISDYEIWDDTFDAQAEIFHKNYSVYPNLALASKDTWRKIDKVANRDNPDNIGGACEDIEELEDEDDIKPISNFMTRDYCIEFCLADKVAKDYVILLFDEDPNFDGEPYEIGDEEKIGVYRMIA